jgi:hypothetical protein
MMETMAVAAAAPQDLLCAMMMTSPLVHQGREIIVFHKNFHIFHIFLHKIHIFHIAFHCCLPLSPKFCGPNAL